RIKNDAGVTKKEFDTYYHKSNFGVAIRIEDKYTTKIPLDEVRQKWKNFKPPQSFHYLNDEDISIAEEITNFSLPKFKSSSQLALNY
ncbi:MAG: hypothetical protein VKL42_17610, partial [Snowella sp.]|nr:hypothetical protein [Snowella sp.]